MKFDVKIVENVLIDIITLMNMRHTFIEFTLESVDIIFWLGK